MMPFALDYFADIPAIAYGGPDSTGELAYRFYDKDRMARRPDALHAAPSDALRRRSRSAGGRRG